MKIDANNRRGYWLALVAITALFAWNAFYQLPNMPLLSWDEARHGVSAKEMIVSGNWLVNTFNGQVDYYNLKPVLSFAPMIAGYETFGFNALGLRFFSALITVFTGLVIMFVVSKELGATKGLLAGLILALVERFFLIHNARTGDPDALYLFFYIAALLLVLGSTKRAWRFALAGFFVGMAFLTKSFHVIPLAVSLVCLVVMRYGFTGMAFKRMLLCVIAGLVPVLVWGFARYQFDGMQFLWKMIEYDVLSRASKPIEGHTGDAFFYVRNLQRDLKFWLVSFVLLALPTLFSKSKRHVEIRSFNLTHLANSWSAQLILCIAINVCLFSSAKSKLDWYVYPAIPLLAILLASWLVDLSRKNYDSHKKYVTGVWMLLALVGIKMEVGIVRQIHKNLLDTDAVVLRIQEINQTAKSPVGLYRANSAWTQADYLAAAQGTMVVLKGGGADAYLTTKDHSKLLLQDGM